MDNWLTLAVDIINVQNGRRLVRTYVKLVDQLLEEIFIAWFYATDTCRERLLSSSSPEVLSSSSADSEPDPELESDNEPDPELAPQFELPSDRMQIID